MLAAAGMESLTNREREVVALVARGLNNDEIARAMVLSPATAKTHVSRAMIKLRARDRAQLVVFAYQSGRVSPRELSPPRLAAPAEQAGPGDQPRAEARALVESAVAFGRGRPGIGRLPDAGPAALRRASLAGARQTAPC